jgi:CubicO group peptidase (beta-lactamase class C family)
MLRRTLLPGALLSALALVPPPAAAASAAPAPAPSARSLPRSSPEAQGIPSSAILAFVEAAEKKVDALHSLMVVRHGQVVAEGWWTPYAEGDPHVLYSLSKSFTSTAVGLAIAEGKLKLDDGVLAAFPDDAPAVAGDNLKALRVRDLLAMSTGHHAEAIDGFPFDADDSLPRLFLALPLAHKPGTHFVYNTPATYMLSAMVQKATGSSVLDYLRPRLFEPLGIENPQWDADKRGVSLGGFGLRVRTEDVARFGQLYLQKGEWQGRRLLPADWVEAATARQVSNGSNPQSDWEQGYGYQFWRCRHGLYRGDGAFGQFCIVMPEQDAVIAITSGTRDMAGVMNLAWEHLLPAMGKSALPADDATAGKLSAKLASLVLPPQAGQATSRLAARVSGRRYVFPANDEKLESVSLEVDRRGAVTLVTRAAGADSRLPVAHAKWGESVRLPLASLGGRAERAAASGAWTAEDAFTVQVAFHETPFVATAVLRFKGDEVAFEREMNVAFGERKRPTLTGRAEPAVEGKRRRSGL